MPVKPPPTKYTCQQCAWQGIAAPQSDKLVIDGETAKTLKIPADYYTSCPNCQSKSLTIKPATTDELLIDSLRRVFS